MYVYLEPHGGINDILCTIQRGIDFCRIHKRILLINGIKAVYNINFSDYFTFDNLDIIYDINEVNVILQNIYNNNSTVYPNVLKDKILDIINGKNIFYYCFEQQNFAYNGMLTGYPNIDDGSELIITSMCGSGNGYPLFSQLKLKENIIDECVKRYSQLKKPYLCIQIRNTDYKCDYELLYENYKYIIHSFDEIYIATDDKEMIKYYKNKNLPIKNFTEFPKDDYFSLHLSNVEPNKKFIDLFCDIYLIAMSDKLLSNSNGNFIGFVKTCFRNKSKIIKQFS
jgi:hypothetical protein